MTTQIKRRQRPMALPHRRIKRRSKAHSPFTYDYDNKGFQQYFRSVTGIHIGDEDDISLSRFLLMDRNADHWLKTSKNFKYLTGVMVPFGEDRENVIRWHKILRDKLQKFWIQYINQPRKLKRRVKPRKLKRR